MLREAKSIVERRMYCEYRRSSRALCIRRTDKYNPAIDNSLRIRHLDGHGLEGVRIDGSTESHGTDRQTFRIHACNGSELGAIRPQ